MYSWNLFLRVRNYRPDRFIRNPIPVEKNKKGQPKKVVPDIGQIKWWMNACDEQYRAGNLEDANRYATLAFNTMKDRPSFSHSFLMLKLIILLINVEEDEEVRRFYLKRYVYNDVIIEQFV